MAINNRKLHLAGLIFGILIQATHWEGLEPLQGEQFHLPPKNASIFSDRRRPVWQVQLHVLCIGMDVHFGNKILSFIYQDNGSTIASRNWVFRFRRNDFDCIGDTPAVDNFDIAVLRAQTI
jgi:hypothetical protein